MRCIIVDDEPLAREGLADYVEKTGFLRLLASAESPLDILPVLKEEGADLLLLDIEMPGMNGLDFLRSLENPPLVIITTAYPGFALEGYELEVADYLVKPITFQRFLKAVLKVQKQFSLEQWARKGGATEKDYFFLKVDGKAERISLDGLLFVESLENYARLYTENGNYTALLSLKKLESHLPCPPFYRAHRSYIVNLRKVQSMEGHLLHIGAKAVPVSRQRVESIRNALFGGRLLD